MNYREEIEKIYGWEINDKMYQGFCDIARHCGSGKLVLDNYSLFLRSEKKKSPYSFFEWWETYRPDVEKVDSQKHDEIVKSKKQQANDGTGLFKDLPWRK
jgi:hypothetical protein